MSGLRNTIASLFSSRFDARSERQASASRLRKLILHGAMLDILEERQLLAGSILTNSVAPYPVAEAALSGPGAEGSSVDQNSTGRKTKVADLDPLARYAVSASIGSDQASYHASAVPGGFSFDHGYRVNMSSTGATFQTGADTWHFTPITYGYGTNQSAIASASPSAEKNRVVYDTAGLDTWFVNGPIGVQQGFTVESRPATGNPSDPLTVIVGLGGSLSATVQADGDGLDLVRPDGGKALTFAGLTAFDATGRVLDAHFELDTTQVSQQLRFVVDDTGAQYPLTIDPFTQSAILTASDGAGGDFFGRSSAISADGSTILVGANQYDYTDPPPPFGTGPSGRGFAYIFTRPAGGWANATQTGKLTPSNYSSSTSGDQFGTSVTLSSDGSIALIGAPGRNGGGAAYIYTRPGGGWANATQSAMITANDISYQFGQAVSLSANGSIALISDPLNPPNGASYVYNRPGSGVWANTTTHSAKLTASDGASGDNLGWAATLNSNGTVALIGAPGVASYKGAAYLFSNSGSSWVQSAKLTASDGAGSDGFGNSVSLNSDGSIALVGASQNNSSGAAYFYTRPGGGWATTSTFNAKLTITETAVNNHFGCSVSLSADGATALVGAYGYNYSPSPPYTDSFKGAAYIYTRPAGGWATTSTFDQRMMASDAVFGDNLGFSVGLSADGATALAGAPFRNGDTGAAYVFSAAPSNETACTTVNTTSDVVNATDNLISLREAIAYAGTLGGANRTITFASNLTSSGNATIVLNSNTANGYGPLLVNLASTNLTLQGPTSGNSITVSGGNATGIFYIRSNTTINNLSIMYGNRANLPYGGAIYNNHSCLTINNSTLANNTSSYDGGAVYNDGSSGNATLTISNSTLANNTASSGSGGAVYNEGYRGNATLTISTSTLANNTAQYGGAVYNDGTNSGNATLTISNSTLANNTASQNGGAVYNRSYSAGKATLTIDNSTLANNTASSGGAVGNDGSFFGDAVLTISTSTLANNTASQNGGAVFNNGNIGRATITLRSTTIALNNAAYGGGIYDNSSAGNLSFYNSIIANNTATNGDGNVNGTISTSNYSLYSSNVAITSNNSSILNTNPQLGTLGNYGGPTQTIPLLSGSPALNSGFNVIGQTDQRGVVYVANSIGSYAYAETAGTVVNTVSDVVDPTDDLISLREAITYAGTLGGANRTITFNSTLTATGNATITLTPGNSPASNGPLLVNMPATNLTIQGPVSGNSITVSGGNATGLFEIRSNTTINNLSIMFGNGANLPGGGAIYSFRNNLTIANSILAFNNSPSQQGGSLRYVGSVSNLTIINSILANNTASDGGAIDLSLSSNSSVMLTNTILADNIAANTGGGLRYIAMGTNSSLVISNSTLANNTAIYNDGGAIGITAYVGGIGSVVISNSTLANNTAANGLGGAIVNWSYGIFGATSSSLTISNSTLADNTAKLGGAITNYVVLGNTSASISSSTLARNTANVGGAIFNLEFSGNIALTISKSTLANNTATEFGGAVFNDGQTLNNTVVSLQGVTVAYNNSANGGGFYNNASLANYTFINSIIANNTATNGDGNVNGTIATSNYSLYSSNVNITSNNSSILNTNPRLGTLGNYGGPTQTIPILKGSPAINGGYNVIGQTDQRGIIYQANSIGASAYTETACTVVDTVADIINSGDGLISLREAINYANVIGGSNQVITFDSTLTSSGNATIVLNSNTANGFGPLVVNITPNLTIQGPTGGNGISVSGNGVTGLFSIYSNTTISNLTLTRANGSGLVAGGAIYSNNTLRLDNVTVNNCTAPAGAAIYQNGGSANLNGVTLGNSLYLTNVANLTTNGGSLAGISANAADVIRITNLNSALSLGLISANSLLVSVVSGAITQVAGTVITVSDSANFVSSGVGSAGNISLNNATNNFGSNVAIYACGTNITIVNSNASGIRLGTMNATGSLTVNATNGSISQTPGTNVTVGETANFVSGGTGVNGNITLGNATNNFNIVQANGTNITIAETSDVTFTSIKGSNVNLTSSGALTVGSSGITANGNAILVANGLITIMNSGINNSSGTGFISVTSTANGITQTAGGLFTSKGNVNLTASNDILITSTGITNNSGTGNLSVTTTYGAVNLGGGPTQTAGSLNVLASGLITISNDLDTSTGGGNINLTSNLSRIVHSGGTIRSNGSITMLAPGNISTGGLGISAAASTQPINMTSTACSVSIGSTIISGGSLRLMANRTVELTSGSIDLRSGTGDVNMTSTNGTVQIAGSGLQSSGHVNMTSAGNITVTSGGVSVTTGTGMVNVTSTGGNISIGGGGITGKRAITIVAANSVSIMNNGASTASGSGNITIVSTFNGISLSAGGDVVSANGQVNLSAATNIQITAGLKSTSDTTITTNNLGITSRVNATLAGNVTIQTMGYGIDLGGADSGSNLGLSNSELNCITARTLNIGNATTANISVTSAISPSNVTNLTLVTGNQINLGANVSVGGNLTFTNATVMTGNSVANGGNVSFGSMINGGSALTVTSAGMKTFPAAIGSTAPLANFTVNGGGTLNLGVNVTTTGAQTYTDPVVLTSDVSLGSTNGVILFSNTVNGGQNLTIAGGTGNVTFNGLVGGGTALNIVNFNSANYINVNANLNSANININGGILLTASRLTTNMTINNGGANIQTGGNITGSAVVNSGSLTSNGTFGSLAINNGSTLYTTSTGTRSGALTFANGSVWNASGSSLADFSKISTTGLVTIQPTANLTLNTPANMIYGNGITLIDQSGSTPINQSTGFTNLPQRTIFTNNNNVLVMNYNGAAGNYTFTSNGVDLVVTVAPGKIQVLNPNLTGTAGQLFTSNLNIRVISDFNNPVGIPGIPVQITLPANVSNSNTASARFDSSNYTNQTITVTSDSNGNISIPLWANNNPGPFQANITNLYNPAEYNYPYMGVIGVAVQQQSINRSYIRYMDVVLSEANLTTLNYSTANFLANFTLTRVKSASFSGGANLTDTRDYLANGPAVPTVYTTPVGYKIDFGMNGLGNQTNTAVFDGVYQLANKAGATVVPANAPYAFHRLLGDANGDGVVDALDTNLIQTVMTTVPWRYQNASNLTYVNSNMSQTSVNPVAAYNWVGDVNGDGKINALDLNIVIYQKGRRVNYTRKVT